MSRVLDICTINISVYFWYESSCNFNCSCLSSVKFQNNNSLLVQVKKAIWPSIQSDCSSLLMIFCITDPDNWKNSSAVFWKLSILVVIALNGNIKTKAFSVYTSFCVPNWMRKEICGCYFQRYEFVHVVNQKLLPFKAAHGYKSCDHCKPLAGQCGAFWCVQLCSCWLLFFFIFAQHCMNVSPLACFTFLFQCGKLWLQLKKT